MKPSSEELLRAYRLMRTIREFEERVRIEFEQGKIPGFIHSYVGQEASAVGVCLHLSVNDWIGSTHRGHGHCIAKGCDVKLMMCELFGRRTGLCAGKGGSMHIADFERGMLGANAIVGGNPPLVLGAALSAKTRRTGGVAVSFTGDGGSNQGTTFESMNMAVVLKLPVIFVIENNGFGEMTSVEYAVGSKSIAARSGAFGMPSTSVDATDFFAVYSTVDQAVKRARAGDGPSVIEAIALRWHGHYGGDPQNYRSVSEREKLRTSDPIAKFKMRVLQEGLLTQGDMTSADLEVEALVSAAVEGALIAEFPAPDDLLRDVYHA